METQNSVQVAGVREITNGDKKFCALDLIALAFKTSKTSGKAYLAPVKASITTSLTKEQASKLVGESLPGTIVRRELPADQYRQWTNPTTKEEMTIKHENVFVPAEV